MSEKEVRQELDRLCATINANTREFAKLPMAPCPKCGRLSKLSAVYGDCFGCIVGMADR